MITAGNDIALLRLSEYIRSATDFPSSVGTICLPKKSIPENEQLMATGWGGINNQGTQAPDLKEVSHQTYCWDKQTSHLFTGGFDHSAL